ncbi:hypothetical protein [Mangrovicoccus sp. HB161399]|uniref:hypothetical protein n=1 Tax=Mangrovicoccus sp. HB161399 TaxID=2720392 RepID=UPI0015529640|nr:hypothetical protein [Mangrovicoccus sp. HB161399]
MPKAFLPLAALLAAAAGAAAAVVASIQETGTSLSIGISGSLDTRGFYVAPDADPYNATMLAAWSVSGAAATPFAWHFTTACGPAMIGSGQDKYPSYDVATGDAFIFEFHGEDAMLGLPADHVSGSGLSVAGHPPSQDFASAWLAQGVYLWTLANGDTVEQAIGSGMPPVPLPAAAPLLLGEPAAPDFAARRRR